MIEIISQLTGTAQERFNQLSELVAVPSGRGKLNSSNFGALTTPEAANLLYQVIEASNKPYALQFVLSGIDTATQTWKDRVDAIDASQVPGLEQLKPLIRDWELTQVTRWVSLGGTGEIPSVETIQAAMDVHAAEESARELQEARATLIAGWRERFDAAMNKLGTPNQAVGVADVLAIADEMEAS